jgi:hypothetical protein
MQGYTPKTTKPPEGGFAPTTVDLTGSEPPAQERSQWQLLRSSSVSHWWMSQDHLLSKLMGRSASHSAGAP